MAARVLGGWGRLVVGELLGELPGGNAEGAVLAEVLAGGLDDEGDEVAL